MKMKVSDYIAQTLRSSGVSQVFTVTGGGAMHLNDSLGHCDQIKCIYHHHEQAAAMAAEAYARVNNDLAVVCVTTGPGSTNAITGVLCAWMDSIPMIVLSGQARYATTVRGSGLRLRTMGIQEYDIVRSVESMTKYAVMVKNAEDIKYHLKRAIFLAKQGRPGPCWLDIPLDVQGAMVEVDSLADYDPDEDLAECAKDISDSTVACIFEKLREAKRPVLYAGHGIRLSGAYESFRKLVDLLGIPVVTGMSSVDLLPSSHPLYVGRSGETGTRAGNFAIQTCDLLLSIGSRQSLMQTGFNYENWAKGAYTILNDIDPEELKKKTLHVDMPVVGDAAQLIDKMLAYVLDHADRDHKTWFSRSEYAGAWIAKCDGWKNSYPVVTGKHYQEIEPGRTNIYAFYDQLSDLLPENSQIVVSVGTSRVAGSQSFYLKEGQRFYTNAVTASMGYGLPAAIGVCMASGGKETIAVMGEGCLQMNIQELQTIIHNRLPIRIFVINNEGYHSIRQTQNRYFEGRYVGIGEESGDLSFPDLSKLSWAYGFPYCMCRSSKTLSNDIKKCLALEPPCICEVFVTKRQNTEPKVAAKANADGTLTSGTLENMFPFLSDEELNKALSCDP